MKNEGKNVLCMSMVRGRGVGVFQGGDSKQSVNDALGPSQEMKAGLEGSQSLLIMLTSSQEKGLKMVLGT